MKKRKDLRLGGGPLMDGADDVASDRAEHVYLPWTTTSYRVTSWDEISLTYSFTPAQRMTRSLGNAFRRSSTPWSVTAVPRRLTSRSCWRPFRWTKPPSVTLLKNKFTERSLRSLPISARPSSPTAVLLKLSSSNSTS